MATKTFYCEGNEKEKIIKPLIKNVAFEGKADFLGKMRFHIDLDLPVTPGINNLELIPKLIKAINDIELENID